MYGISGGRTPLAWDGGKRMLEIMAEAGAQLVPKWHLDGQLAGIDFFNMRARRNARRAKKVSVFAGSGFGWIGLA